MSPRETCFGGSLGWSGHLFDIQNFGASVRVSFWIRFWLDYYIIISLLLKYGEGDDRNEGAQATPVVFCGGQVVSSHVGDREKHGRTTPKPNQDCRATPDECEGIAFCNMLPNN